MSSPCLTQQQAAEGKTAVRVVQRFDDPFAGLKGHDYIAARQLNRPAQRVQTSAQTVASTQQEVK